MKALITGVAGQDGSYLAEFLLDKGYEVHGLVRPSRSGNTWNLDHLLGRPESDSGRLTLHHGDVTDGRMLSSLIRQIQPGEIYNLAGQSDVGLSLKLPEYTAEVNGMGVVRLMEAIRAADVWCKVFQPSAGEMFGNAPPPQNEDTPFEPCSPYGVSKLFAHWGIVGYRTGHNMFACSGILFDHDSPRKGETSPTRRITRALARIITGEHQTISLGNLDAKRDWGYAPDYVEAMWMMLQQEQPDDFVIATGKCHSLRDFLTEAFSLVNLSWDHYVQANSNGVRPTEIRMLRGDASKVRRKLNWEARTSFKELVRRMVEADLAVAGVSLETGASVTEDEYLLAVHGNGRRLERYREVSRGRIGPMRQMEMRR